jgi:hypothetical protein
VPVRHYDVIRTDLHPVVRAVAYAAIAALVAFGIGTLTQGSLGGGVVLGIAVGLGVAVGLLGYELVNR